MQLNAWRAAEGENYVRLWHSLMYAQKVTAKAEPGMSYGLCMVLSRVDLRKCKI